MTHDQFPPLSEVTRPTITTPEAAFYLNYARQTLRGWACMERGPIRPIRLPGSSKLHWRTADIRRLLEAEVAS